MSPNMLQWGEFGARVGVPRVLDLLKRYNAKATFFCIGNNVIGNDPVYQRILAEEHVTGNHTYDHLNGWKTPDKEYLDNISKAGEIIRSNLFRPPYGRITKFQLQQLSPAIQAKPLQV